MLAPLKNYLIRKDHSTGKKLYYPLYKGQMIPLSQYPVMRPWAYTTANEAQAHAERFYVRKYKQNERLANEDRRDKVMRRYLQLIKVALGVKEPDE